MSEEVRHEFVFRCIVTPGENDSRKGYFANCIDLNLLVWRPTPREVKHALEEAILGYLETAAAASSSHDEFHELINRPAPFWPYQAKYRLAAFRRALSSADSPPKLVLYDLPAQEPVLAYS